MIRIGVICTGSDQSVGVSPSFVRKYKNLHLVQYSRALRDAEVALLLVLILGEGFSNCIPALSSLRGRGCFIGHSPSVISVIHLPNSHFYQLYDFCAPPVASTAKVRTIERISRIIHLEH